MSGRPLDAFRVLPVMLLRHLGKELGIPVPDIASLRALYSRWRTLSDHQDLACRWLGFSWMTPHQRGALVRVLRDEVVGCADREQLLAHARRWLYAPAAHRPREGAARARGGGVAGAFGLRRPWSRLLPVARWAPSRPGDEARAELTTPERLME